ncbi:MAG: nuclear transport factor 2 family protein [Deltaproteobacteria bacterium]|nr:nuclear transport factor 2 family protein [Deltaproteobacteria bacterium]
MRSRLTALALTLCTHTPACATITSRSAHIATPTERAAVDAVLDDWHAAAAASELDRYMRHMAETGVFLGTDATERWSKSELRTYAARPFAAGHGWRMRARRRAVSVLGDVAYFDEDLETVSLGPARGTGVLALEAGRWRILQYNLTITVPNERFGAVHALLAAP